MKILHLCLGCFYVDYYSYQENMLPKYHKQLGYDVEILASTLSFDKNGNSCNIESSEYINEYGIKVKRLDYLKYLPRKVAKFFRIYDGVYDAIFSCKPDIIFIHGCQFCDITKVVRYVKENNVKVFVDNHADFSNSARNFISKNIIHKIIWKKCAKLIEPYVSKFYGVLPARVDFLKKIYSIPEEKVDLLVMGADDDLVERNSRPELKHTLKEKLGINENDFVIVSGGKIDKAKIQTLFLMKAVKNIKNVTLIVFGSVIKELKDDFDSLVGNNVKYVGWLNSIDIYSYISIADLVIYPGRHSVLWEQTVAQGKPMVVKYWDGNCHIDIGGNIKYLYDDSEKEISDIIKTLLVEDKKEYIKMLKVASSDKKNRFLYSEIAKNSIIARDV